MIPCVYSLGSTGDEFIPRPSVYASTSFRVRIFVLPCMRPRPSVYAFSSFRVCIFVLPCTPIRKPENQRTRELQEARDIPEKGRTICGYFRLTYKKCFKRTPRRIGKPYIFDTAIPEAETALDVILVVRSVSRDPETLLGHLRCFERQTCRNGLQPKSP